MRKAFCLNPCFLFRQKSEKTYKFECAYSKHNLTVGLGDTLQLILLLDGVGVGRALGGVDELISKALSNGLDVAESRLTGLLRSK